MKNEQNINLSEETTTLEQQNSNHQNPSPKKKPGVWKSVLIGGVPGIILGTAGTAFAQEVAGTETQNAENGTATDSPVGTETINPQNIDAPVSESVNDEMSFSEAFEAAREEVGPGGVFEWHGNVYNTYTAGEWNSMSDEDRQTFAESASEHSHADDSGAEEPQGEDPQDVPEDENVVEEEEEGEGTIDGEPEISEIPEIEIHEIQSITTEQGEIVNVAVATVDNHDAQFVDVDNDGYVDGVLIDANDDGSIQENEVIATPDSGVAMSDLAMMSDHSEDSLYQDTPDYTNDADTSSLA